MTNLNDGEEIECACKTAIARNRWILLLKDAVTSAEGTNTMSQECFVKLIESQLKVFVQRRIARDMLVADMMSVSSENHAVHFVLKHLVGAMAKPTPLSAMASQNVPLTEPISAYLPVEYPPDKARAASSRSGRTHTGFQQAQNEN